MTTNFALSLSFDGIRLLQRVADGWHLVGDVVLDSADLKGDLADLREKALSLDPSGLRCKILIPEEQIKYITLETAQTDINDVMEKHKQMKGFHKFLKQKRSRNEPMPESREDLMMMYRIERPAFLMAKRNPFRRYAPKVSA